MAGAWINERAAVPRVQAPATKKNNLIKTQEMKRRAERAFAAKPLGESPLSVAWRRYHLTLCFFSIGLFFFVSA